MWFNIIFFLVACLVNLTQRTLLRFDIKKKYWIKHRSGKLISDWLLWPFREGERKLWIDVHLAFSIAIPVAFIFGLVGFLFERAAILQLLPMIVLFVSLCSLGCRLLTIGYPEHYGKARRIEGSIFAVIFILLMIALSVYLSYAFIKGLFYM